MATYIVEKFTIFRCPSDLHDAWCYNQHLIIPDAFADLKRASNALERSCITPRLLGKETHKYSVLSLRMPHLR